MINEENIKKTVPIINIKIGGYFKWRDKLYLKTGNEINTNFDYYWCVEIDTGNIIRLPYGAEVTPINEKKQILLKALAEEDVQTLALAYAHAQYLKMYGVDIEKALCTATENAEAMTAAYQKGYYDAMERGVRMKEHKEHGELTDPFGDGSSLFGG